MLCDILDTSKALKLSPVSSTLHAIFFFLHFFTSVLGILLHLVKVRGYVILGMINHNLRKKSGNPNYSHILILSLFIEYPSPHYRITLDSFKCFNNAKYFFCVFSNQSDIIRQQIRNVFVIEPGTKDTVKKHIKMFSKS